jgi:GT2 family glycosyltransferase
MNAEARPANTARVSVVIPTYNHARFLGEAIGSALGQTIAPAEVIVVDDGSTDHPERVTGQFAEVRLIRQDNRGLAAARNTGLRASAGEYIVFLDADDRLLPRALEVNLRQFAERPDCGFVYGGHRHIDTKGALETEIPFRASGEDAYATLLSQNCISMHATVMYRRERLESVGGFDTRFRACEDYDVYLRMARLFPVACDPESLAEYRQHGANMTRNTPLMLEAALAVLRRQRAAARSRPEWREAYRRGILGWKRHYASEQVLKARAARSASEPWVGPLMRVMRLAPLETPRAAVELWRARGRDG